MSKSNLSNVEFDDLEFKDQLKRVERIVTVLEGLSDHEQAKHFDMGEWGTKNECGTSACAAGFCALNPWFRRNGFSGELKTVESYDGSDEVVMKWNGMDPQLYFGSAVYDNVFTSDSLTELRGKRAVKAVIKRVKALVVKMKAAEAFTQADLAFDDLVYA